MSEPLVVTAHLVNGYEAYDPWTPDLVGILAYWQLRDQLGEEEFALGCTGARSLVMPDLPLATETHDGVTWWQCSSPLVAVVRAYTTHTHRRFDDQYAVTYVPLSVRKVLTAGGPYKVYRTPHTLRLTESIQWHCVGDADAIRRLLARCGNVGKGHTHGHGAVRRWSVERGGDGYRARFGRPLPVAFARAHGVTGMEMDYALPLRQSPRVRCIMPGDADGG